MTTEIVEQGYPVVTDLVAAQPSREVDIRVYNADGTRKYLPQSWIGELSFEIAERGGAQTGSIQFLAAWEDLAFVGNEYIDVRLFGGSEILYRGYVRQPQQELGNPERSTPTLHGLMELLNGYLVRRDFFYSPAVSPDTFFDDLCAQCVTTSDKMPALVLDTAGVGGLSLTLSSLACKGKTVPQVLNALCDLFPNELIWGCDVEGVTNLNRLYLRPRASHVLYTYVVGGQVGAYVYPRDCTKIVNKVYVTGGKVNTTDATLANLLPNASFEDAVAIGELTSNILENASFEDGFDHWDYDGAVPASGFGRTGNGAAELNNDAATPEYVAQDVPVASNLTGAHAACYWNARLNTIVWTNQIKFELKNGGTWDSDGLYSGGSVVASSTQSPVTGISDGPGYTYHRYFYDWSVPGSLTYDCLRVSFILTTDSPTGFSGQTILDDCALWLDGTSAAKSWRVSRGHIGTFSAIDWQNSEVTPYDGAVCVKATAQVTTASGNYAEIATTEADRPQGQPRRAYLINFKVQAVTSGTQQFQAGARIYQGGQLKSTVLGAAQFGTVGSWIDVSASVGSGNDCDAIEPFLRFLTDGVAYVDAAAMYVDRDSLPTEYSPDDTFRGVRSVTDYTSVEIGDAVDSLATWGLREAEVTNENVTDETTLEAFAQSYLRAYGVPDVQARLTIQGATKAAGLDGLYRIVNLPSAPPALPAARLNYRIGSDWINIEAQLNSERPTMAKLLRQVSAGKT